MNKLSIMKVRKLNVMETIIASFLAECLVLLL
jgi:hypothetical protein